MTAYIWTNEERYIRWTHLRRAFDMRPEAKPALPGLTDTLAALAFCAQAIEYAQAQNLKGYLDHIQEWRQDNQIIASNVWRMYCPPEWATRGMLRPTNHHWKWKEMGRY